MQDKDRSRLEKLLNMLGSDFDNERANAGSMIKKMADAANQSVAEYVLTNQRAAPSSGPQYPPRSSWADHAASRAQAQAEREKRWRNEEEHARRRQQWERDEQARREQARQRDQERHEQRRKEAEARRASREPKIFKRPYYGILGRLLDLYQGQFAKLQEFEIDFIEFTLTNHIADRQLIRRNMEMAKAILKSRLEEPDDLI